MVSEFMQPSNGQTFELVLEAKFWGSHGAPVFFSIPKHADVSPLEVFHCPDSGFALQEDLFKTPSSTTQLSPCAHKAVAQDLGMCQILLGTTYFGHPFSILRDDPLFGCLLSAWCLHRLSKMWLRVIIKTA